MTKRGSLSHLAEAAAQAGAPAAHARRAVGRPTLYRPEFCEMISREMASGLSVDAAAAKVGISARSLFKWQHEHPEFLHAIQEGRQRALLWWEERALEMARGKGGNAQIVSLGLRNRSRSASGWLDNQRLEHSGPDGAPIRQETTVRQLDVSGLTLEELEALEKALVNTGLAGKPK
jgi:hypothetical protein